MSPPFKQQSLSVRTCSMWSLFIKSTELANDFNTELYMLAN